MSKLVLFINNLSVYHFGNFDVPNYFCSIYSENEMSESTIVLSLLFKDGHHYLCDI